MNCQTEHGVKDYIKTSSVVTNLVTQGTFLAQGIRRV